MGNIVYKTDNLEKYFSTNRIRWDQFYRSEQEVIEKVWPKGNPAVLDIGCGCGGLSHALRERFGNLNSYTGIELNEKSAQTARALCPRDNIIHGDFLEMDPTEFSSGLYDVVFSLSCIDWNVSFDPMFAKAWTMVKQNGIFIASFRLTLDEGINDINRSYQYINYEGALEGERASYVVLNAVDLMRRVRQFGTSLIYGYGYWGEPSKTAVTLYDKVCFAVLAMTKSEQPRQPLIDLSFPQEVAVAMRSVFKGKDL